MAFAVGVEVCKVKPLTHTHIDIGLERNVKNGGDIFCKSMPHPFKGDSIMTTEIKEGEKKAVEQEVRVLFRNDNIQIERVPLDETQSVICIFKRGEEKPVVGYFDGLTMLSHSGDAINEEVNKEPMVFESEEDIVQFFLV